MSTDRMSLVTELHTFATEEAIQGGAVSLLRRAAFALESLLTVSNHIVEEAAKAQYGDTAKWEALSATPGGRQTMEDWRHDVRVGLEAAVAAQLREIAEREGQLSELQLNRLLTAARHGEQPARSDDISTVNSAAELDVLPVGTEIRDTDGVAWKMILPPMGDLRSFWAQFNSKWQYPSYELKLPVTVSRSPEAGK